MPDLHWFAVTINSKCPACGTTAIEKMSISAAVPDPNIINEKLKAEKLGCRQCGKRLRYGVDVLVTVRQCRLDELATLGFPPPSGASRKAHG
jgi:hypothetical protein